MAWQHNAFIKHNEQTEDTINLSFFVLASPVTWFPTYSNGSGKICHQKKLGVHVPSKEMQHVLMYS